MENNKFVPYRKLPNAKSKYDSKNKENDLRQPLTMRRLIEDNSEAVIQYAINKGKELMNVDVQKGEILRNIMSGDGGVNIESKEAMGDVNDDDNDVSSDEESFNESSDSDDNDNDDARAVEGQKTNKKTTLWIKSVLSDKLIRKVNLDSVVTVQPRRTQKLPDVESSQCSEEVGVSVLSVATCRDNKRKKPIPSLSINGSNKQSGRLSSDNAVPHGQSIISDLSILGQGDYVIVSPISREQSRFWVGRIGRQKAGELGFIPSSFNIVWLEASCERGPYNTEMVDGKNPRCDIIDATKVIAGFHTLMNDSTIPAYVMDFIDRDMPKIDLVQPKKKRTQTSRATKNS
jgi:hypothetical protein